jgi:hypothetical protein
MVVSGRVRPTPVTLNPSSTASQRIKLRIFTAAERFAREFAREEILVMAHFSLVRSTQALIDV